MKRKNPPLERRLDRCDFPGSEIPRVNHQHARRRQCVKQCGPRGRRKFLLAEQDCFETSQKELALETFRRAWSALNDQQAGEMPVTLCAFLLRDPASRPSIGSGAFK